MSKFKVELETDEEEEDIKYEPPDSNDENIPDQRASPSSPSVSTFSQPPGKLSSTTKEEIAFTKQRLQNIIEKSAKQKNSTNDNREPLQLVSCNTDLSKYRDFIHCCKCFSTFYKMDDLALHFDQCTLPYHDFSFKNFKLHQVEQYQEKNQDELESNNIEMKNQSDQVNVHVDVNIEDEVNSEMSPAEVEVEVTLDSRENEIILSENNEKTFESGSKVTTADLSNLSSPPLSHAQYIRQLNANWKARLKMSTPKSNKIKSKRPEGGPKSGVEKKKRKNPGNNSPCLCVECGKMCKTSYCLQVHMKHHQRLSAGFKCTFEGCNQTFSMRKHLRKHEIRIHYPEKKIPCTVEGCSKSFVDNFEMRDHCNLVHLKVTPYKCRDPNCTAMFSTTRDRSKHFRRDHSGRPFPCPVENCGKSFKTRHDLRIHSPTHIDKNERRTFVCDFPECGAKFTRQESVNHHKRVTHEPDRPKNVLCSICGKTFFVQKDLDSHMISHSQEKPHLCSMCGRGFKTSTVLKNHLKTHTGERNHQCRHCDKSFISASVRARHEQTHTGFRPYQCKFCEDRFPDNRILKRHVEGQHGDCEFNLNDPPTYQIYHKPKPADMGQDSSTS